MSGGGGSTNSTSTSYTTNVPEYAKPYVMQTLGQASALTNTANNPYQPYQGQRQADVNPLQQQAIQNVGQMGVSDQTGQASDLANNAGQNAMGASNNFQGVGDTNYYNSPAAQSVGLGYSNVNSPQLNQYQMQQPGDINAPQLNNYQMGGPQQVGTQNFTGANVNQYMSPYMNDVVDQQKQAAIRDYSNNLPQLGADAQRVGGLGGTRSALMESEANRNLQNNLQGIQAAGSQAAYGNAQNQFNTQQQANLQAQQANQQAGLATGQANLGAALGVQQLGAGQNMQSQMANQQMGYNTGAQNLQAQLGIQQLGSGQYMQGQMANQQAGLQNQQMGLNQAQGLNQFGLQNASNNAQYGLAGAQLGLQSQMDAGQLYNQGISNQLQSSGQLGQLGQNQYQQQTGITQAQMNAGNYLQGQQQTGLNNAYQDFLNQQNYPYKQLGFMSDLIHGTAAQNTNSGSAVYQGPGNTAGQVAGLAGGLGSLFMGMGGG